MPSLMQQSAKIAITPAASTATPSKRAVNLTLSDGLVVQAKSYTSNLSATVESLLSDYVAAQLHATVARQQQANKWCADWNMVHASLGSFADEHSTL